MRAGDPSAPKRSAPACAATLPTRRACSARGVVSQRVRRLLYRGGVGERAIEHASLGYSIRDASAPERHVMAKKAKSLRLGPTAPRERPLWDTLNSMAAAVERWDYVPPSLLDRRSAAQALRYMADYFWVQENGPAPGK